MQNSHLTKMPKTYRDPCSLSNFNFYVQTHAQLDWHVDFSRKVIHGTCTLTFELNNEETNAKTIILDTRDLTIKNVTESSTNTNLEFCVGKVTPCFGSPLTINLKAIEK